MATATTTARPAPDRPGRAPGRGRGPGGALPTAVLLLGALYCLVPVAWVVVAATKTRGQLFTTFTFLPGTGLLDNLADLLTYNGGQFGGWALNSLVYAGVGAGASTLVSALAGYALAKYSFAGRSAVFYLVLAGVLIPGITLAVPQYLIMSDLGLAGSRWSVLLPSVISPFGIYLARVFAVSVPDDTIEAARIDGAGEARIFTSIALPMLVPGLVTLFMLQFVGIWNNFLLPFIMLADQDKYPLTVGLYTLLSRGSGEPGLYSLAIIGAALSVVPLAALMLTLQRYWRLDVLSGGLKG